MNGFLCVALSEKILKAMKQVLLFLVLLFSSPSMAQDAISTDRPDESENSSVVPYKRFQTEAGVQHFQSAENSREFTVPTVLWKYGIYKNIELRLTTSYGYENDEGELSSGLQPVIAGFKVQFLKQNGLLPETALLAQAEIPKLASADYKQTHLAPEVRLLFKNKINDKLELSYNAGASWDSEDLVPTYIYTVSSGYKITKKLSAFIENYAYFSADEQPDYWIDGGLLIFLTEDILLDFAAGYELSEQNNYHRFYESVGVSFRL